MKFLAASFLALAAALGSAWAAPISTQELSDMSAQGYRLLDLEEGVPPVWKTEDEKLDLLRAGVHFVCPFHPSARIRRLIRVLSSMLPRFTTLRKSRLRLPW